MNQWGDRQKIALGVTGLPVTEDWQDAMAQRGYPYGYKVPCPHCGQPMNPAAQQQASSNDGDCDASTS